MSNGRSAAKAILSKAVWKTANSAVAAVNSVGKITARTPGRTRVTAQIGTIRASIRVTVTSLIAPNPGVGSSVPAPPPTSGPSPQPTHQHSPQPTPTLTPTPLGPNSGPGQRPGLSPHGIAEAFLIAIRPCPANRGDRQAHCRQSRGWHPADAAIQLLSLPGLTDRLVCL
jgi:hypothetical protein